MFIPGIEIEEKRIPERVVQGVEEQLYATRFAPGIVVEV